MLIDFCFYTISHECCSCENESTSCARSTYYAVQKSKAIVYSHLDSIQTYCNDKIGRMIQAHIQACGELLNRIEDKTDQMLIEKEIADLKIILDLVRYVN